MSEGGPLATMALPHWLRVLWGPDFPSQWEVIGCCFLRVVSVLVENEPPDRMLICLDFVYGSLRIRFGGRSELPAHQTRIIRAAATQFEALVNGTAALQVSPSDMEVSDTVRNGDVAVYADPCIETLHQGKTEPPPTSDEAATIRAPGAEDLDLDAQILLFKGVTSVQAEEESFVGRDEDTTKRLRAIMRRLQQSGSYRPLRRPAADWQDRLNRLEADFGNFAEVITTIVRPHLFMLSRGHRHRMAPMVLVGPPGVGKTQFARELQSIFAVPAIFVMMAGETNGSALAGSSIFWANSSPGRPFESVAWGGSDCSGGAVANPLVIVDEVDKVGEGSYDPLAALYTLLEQETAAKFEDQSVPGVLCDMQYVSFVLTANDENAIPAPLRSRVCEFQIEAPDAVQARRIAIRIFAGLREKYNVGLDGDLPDEVLSEAARLSPREAKIRLEAAMAIAAASGKGNLDFASWQQAAPRVSSKKTRVGFT